MVERFTIRRLCAERLCAAHFADRDRLGVFTSGDWRRANLGRLITAAYDNSPPGPAGCWARGV